MKFGPTSNQKLFGLGSIYLFITIILVWLVSSNLLFVNEKLNNIVDRVFSKLGVHEQTSLTEFSDLDQYLKGILLGIRNSKIFPTIDVQVKQKNILILNSDRKNGGRSYVPATFTIYEAGKIKNLKGKIRAKGDRKLHSESFANMSLRTNLKGDDRLFGLEEFSIQDPILRGYTWELLVADIFKTQGLLTLQSKVANFSFNGEDRGLYVFEEVPSKITVERNLRKSGPIFGLKEEYGPNLDSVLDVYDFKDWEGSKIYNFARENLLMQFSEVRGGGVFSEELFDLDEWARYFALIDLFGTYHGSVPKSVRFYFNPVIGKFQPILFDAHKNAGYFDEYTLADHKLSPKSAECEWTCRDKDFYMGFLNNKYFFDAYQSYLEKFSTLDFIESIENVYMDKFEQLDHIFYSSLSRSDGISFRGFGLYFFKFSEIERRRHLLSRRVTQLNEHKETFTFWSLDNSKKKLLSSKNGVTAPEGVMVVSIENHVMEGTVWNFKQPTILLLSGNTILKGLSKDSPLNITGPVMLVQQGGMISLDNINFIKPMYIDVPSRQWSGAVNIINAKAEVGRILIQDSNAEDAINFVNSTYEIQNLIISGSKSDAIDFDFSSGGVNKISCFNIGNDCVDASESSIIINGLVAKNVQDKGVSAGENSILKINMFDAQNVALGLVSKDGSKLEVDEFRVSGVELAISAYKKKPEYSSPSLIVKKAYSPEPQSQFQALVSNDTNLETPDGFNILIEDSKAIESRMYGVEFGKATVK